MSIHIIIDGYNLIRQSAVLAPLDAEDMQLGRDTLIDMLAAYKKLKAHKITVVFDGTMAPDYFDKRNQVKGISIRFSRTGELADSVIKRMASTEKAKALVVSSDRDIMNHAEIHGAAAIESPEFEQRITMASYMAEKGLGPEDEEKTVWRPTTKKKGPSKRLSKKARRNRMKIRKL